MSQRCGRFRQNASPAMASRSHPCNQRIRTIFRQTWQTERNTNQFRKSACSCINIINCHRISMWILHSPLCYPLPGWVWALHPDVNWLPVLAWNIVMLNNGTAHGLLLQLLRQPSSRIGSFLQQRRWRSDPQIRWCDRSMICVSWHRGICWWSEIFHFEKERPPATFPPRPVMVLVLFTLKHNFNKDLSSVKSK